MPGRRVVRLRALTPAQVQRLQGLRKLSTLLDSAFTVPGTSYRIGLDPIIGLIPGFGDLVTPLFTVGVLLQGWHLGIPKVVQLRMIFNVAIDSLLGAVPIAGDLFDFAWKANDMNLTLLERHAYEEHRPTPGDWAFVSLMVLIVLVLAALPVMLMIWLGSMVARVL